MRSLLRIVIYEAREICNDNVVNNMLRAPENGNALNGGAKIASDMSLAVSNACEPESEEKPQKSLNEKQQENQDLLRPSPQNTVICKWSRALADWMISGKWKQNIRHFCLNNSSLPCLKNYMGRRHDACSDR